MFSLITERLMKMTSNNRIFPLIFFPVTQGFLPGAKGNHPSCTDVCVYACIFKKNSMTSLKT